MRKIWLRRPIFGPFVSLPNLPGEKLPCLHAFHVGRGKGQFKAGNEVNKMKNLSALVAALLLIMGLSAGTVMAYDEEMSYPEQMSEEHVELEQAISDGESE